MDKKAILSQNIEYYCIVNICIIKNFNKIRYNLIKHEHLREILV